MDSLSTIDPMSTPISFSNSVTPSVFDENRSTYREDGKSSDSSDDDDFIVIDSDGSSLSSDSTSTLSDDEINRKKKFVGRVPRETKTKGEFGLDDLPRIEDLRITVSERDIRLIGNITGIVDRLVVVQSLKDSTPLDIDSVLFLSPDKPLGRVFDTFGPVVEPLYAVRFNSLDEIKEKDIKIDADVYYVPGNNDITSYVFVKDLAREKGSDASWRDNNEPPVECIDYSDDEQEKQARQKRRAKSRRKSQNGLDYDSAETNSCTDTESQYGAYRPLKRQNLSDARVPMYSNQLPNRPQNGIFRTPQSIRPLIQPAHLRNPHAVRLPMTRAPIFRPPPPPMNFRMMRPAKFTASTRFQMQEPSHNFGMPPSRNLMPGQNFEMSQSVLAHEINRMPTHGSFRAPVPRFQMSRSVSSPGFPAPALIRYQKEQSVSLRDVRMAPPREFSILAPRISLPAIPIKQEGRMPPPKTSDVPTPYVQMTPIHRDFTAPPPRNFARSASLPDIKVLEPGVGEPYSQVPEPNVGPSYALEPELGVGAPYARASEPGVGAPYAHVLEPDEVPYTRIARQGPEVPCTRVSEPIVGPPYARMPEPGVRSPYAQMPEPGVVPPYSPVPEPFVGTPYARASEPSVEAPYARTSEPSVEAPYARTSEPGVGAPYARASEPVVGAPTVPHLQVIQSGLVHNNRGPMQEFQMSQSASPQNIRMPIQPLHVPESASPQANVKPVQQFQMLQPASPQDIRMPIQQFQMSQPISPQDIRKPVQQFQMSQPTSPQDVRRPVQQFQTSQPASPQDVRMPVPQFRMSQTVSSQGIRGPVQQQHFRISQPTSPQDRIPQQLQSFRMSAPVPNFRMPQLSSVQDGRMPPSGGFAPSTSHLQMSQPTSEQNVMPPEKDLIESDPTSHYKMSEQTLLPQDARVPQPQNCETSQPQFQMSSSQSSARPFRSQMPTFHDNYSQNAQFRYAVPPTRYSNIFFPPRPYFSAPNQVEFQCAPYTQWPCPQQPPSTGILLQPARLAPRPPLFAAPAVFLQPLCPTPPPAVRTRFSYTPVNYPTSEQVRF